MADQKTNKKLSQLCCGYGKRVKLRSVILLILLCGVSASLFARTLKIGISQNPPKLFLDDQGKPSGIYVDILSYIAEQEDWDLEYRLGDWNQLLLLVQQGEIDILPDVAYSTERAVKLSFNETPVLFSWSQIYQRKGLNLNTITDLDGYRVAVLKNSIQASSLAKLISGFGMNTELVFADSFDGAMALVRAGEADAAATNSFYGRSSAGRYGLEDSPVVFEPSSLYFASAKGQNQDILDTIEAHLQKLKDTPHSIYFQSLKRWSLTEKDYRIPSWIWFGLTVLGSLLITILISWFILKKKVRERTKELMHANLEMEKRVDERTEELNMALQQAKVADMLKSAFLATMSHELRTPLNSIIGFTGIMLQELPGKINEEQRKQLNIVQGSSRHLLSLINDVLDISKIEAGGLEIKYSEILPERNLKKLLELVSTQAANKGLELELACDAASGSIITDERRFEQIILNLLSNAIKFTEKGKVSLICDKAGDKLRVRVKDTGIGIQPDQFDKVFSPFQQIDTGLTRMYDGSGLGLSISKKLANLMGGDILVNSEFGKGSTFSLELPFKPKEEACKG